MGVEDDHGGPRKLLHADEFAIAGRERHTQDALLLFQWPPLRRLPIHYFKCDRLREANRQLAGLVNAVVYRQQIAILLLVMQDADEKRLAFRLKPEVRRRLVRADRQR